jgi:hypothetical protein
MNRKRKRLGGGIEMQYQPGFTVTYHANSGKIYKAYIPPAWMLTGKERREKAERDRRFWIEVGKVVETRWRI